MGKRRCTLDKNIWQLSVFFFVIVIYHCSKPENVHVPDDVCGIIKFSGVSIKEKWRFQRMLFPLHETHDLT